MCLVVVGLCVFLCLEENVLGNVNVDYWLAP
jgi:hypothetical protein